MKNPLEKLELKTWPDILLAMVALPFVISFGAMFPISTRSFAVPITLIVAGIVLFGIAGKLSYHRYHDKSTAGNSNTWVAGWRHSFLGNSIATIGISLVVAGAVAIFI